MECPLGTVVFVPNVYCLEHLLRQPQPAGVSPMQSSLGAQLPSPFLILSVLGFELRDSYVLGRRSTI
jgi:hypothetical protein